MTLKYLNLTGLNALVSAIKTWVLSRIPTKTSELTNDASFITTNSASTTYAPISHNHDASEITSGTIDIARLPPAALERMHIVADQTARYALTTSIVQEGDTVKQTDTGVMYLVVDSTKLNSADGYVEYSAGTASKAIADEDGTSIKTGYVNVAGNQTVTGDKSFTGSNTFNNILPNATNSYSLGSSSYQWSSVYAQTYYYNGTAWGLDKSNTWSAEQTCKASSPKWINRQNNVTIGVAPVSNQTCAFYNYDKDGYELGRLITRVHSDGKTVTWIAATNLYRNGAIDPNGTSTWANLYCAINGDGYPWVGTDCDFIPNASAIYNLGTPTNKWKTLNGVNPGALSLPQVVTTFEDLTGYVLDGVTENQFPISGLTTLDGWLQCRVTHTLGVASFLRMETSYRVWTASDKDCIEEYVLWVPVKAGMSFNKVVCKADNLKIRFHPMMGNV